ncbi:unnamed protein product [Acanthosepion pharaonis]|uniref:Uncharacterized protein n=1 Tax=Acanthosepion pharaonis TaxID=158019 RepID=A0A812C5Y4_ACAPH|nr:unnamed protein product [Sepia pharaonis]
MHTVSIRFKKTKKKKHRFKESVHNFPKSSIQSAPSVKALIQEDGAPSVKRSIQEDGAPSVKRSIQKRFDSRVHPPCASIQGRCTLHLSLRFKRTVHTPEIQGARCTFRQRRFKENMHTPLKRFDSRGRCTSVKRFRFKRTVHLRETRLFKDGAPPLNARFKRTVHPPNKSIQEGRCTLRETLDSRGRCTLRETLDSRGRCTLRETLDSRGRCTLRETLDSKHSIGPSIQGIVDTSLYGCRIFQSQLSMKLPKRSWDIKKSRNFQP